MLRQRLGAFFGVGALAAATHWLSVVALVELAGLPALAANLPAWCLAFAVSFAGHRLLTFGDRRVRVAHSLPRFAATSLLGLAVNEAVLAALTRAGLHYALALVAAMLVAAASTYLLGSRWAFRDAGRS